MARASERIEDVGAKIGGARKDRFSNGMSLEDLAELSAAEAAVYTTKDMAWPAPDYAALIEGGMPLETAAFVKLVRDRMSARPTLPGDPERARVAVEDFVVMTTAVRNACLSAKDVEDIGSRDADLRIRASAGIDVENWRDPVGRARGHSVWKDTKYAPWMRRFGDEQRLAKMIANGFPEKRAPWLKGVTVKEEGGRFHAVVKFRRISGEGYETAVALEAWLKEGYEKALAEKNSDRKEEPRRPHLKSFERVGLADRRDGRRVTAEDFRATFGFRGVEFGNYLPNDERQQVLDLGYDALLDFAEVLDIAPEAVSLNGRLGLAFGARGKGSAMAHYEATYLAINLTRLSGGGSIAHEWAHALDHYAGDVDAPPSNGEVRSGTGWRGPAGDRVAALKNVTPAEAAAWQAVMRRINLRPMTREEASERITERVVALEKELLKLEADRAKVLGDARLLAQNKKFLRYAEARIPSLGSRIKGLKEKAEETLTLPQGDDFGECASNYVKQSALVSGSSSRGGETPYWIRPNELFARGFESMVFDRLAADGKSSPFLVQGVEEDRFAAATYSGNPYPVGEERVAIGAAVGEVVDAMAFRLGRESAPGLKA